MNHSCLWKKPIISQSCFVIEYYPLFSNSFYSIQLFNKSFKTWKINYFAIFLQQLLHS